MFLSTWRGAIRASTGQLSPQRSRSFPLIPRKVDRQRETSKKKGARTNLFPALDKVQGSDESMGGSAGKDTTQDTGTVV